MTQLAQRDVLATRPVGPALLDVRHLTTHLATRAGVVHAVDDVSFSIARGETLVGESGCGKSMTALSILRLIPEPAGRIVSGEILFEDEDLLQLPAEEMRRLRGGRIGIVFQDPMTSLNPVHTVADQIAESVRIHHGMSRQPAADQRRRSDPRDRTDGVPGLPVRRGRPCPRLAHPAGGASAAGEAGRRRHAGPRACRTRSRS